jgi:glycosyltransferase involved in cell wall biosynthesis
LQIIGPGDAAYREALIEKYQPKDLEFLGALPHEEVMARLAGCDLFVLPSYAEGFPNAVLEAMAQGKAIVATDVGAIPEMLDTGCGLLVSPKDVVGLKKALQSMLSDDRLRAETGERARARSSANYSIDAVFAEYATVWRSACDCKR